MRFITKCSRKISLVVLIGFYILLIFIIHISFFSDEAIAQNSNDTALEDYGSKEPLWWKTYHKNYYDEGVEVQLTDDGGFIIVGKTKASSYEHDDTSSEWDIWLIKVSSTGEEEWNKTFNGIYDDFGYAVKQTSDGGYIITGETSGPHFARYYDIWVIKTTSTGEEEWNSTFGYENDDAGYDILETTDGGYLIAGETKSYDKNIKDEVSDVYLIKINSTGKEIWSRRFGGSRNDSAYCIQATDDGGYIIVGSTEVYGVYSYKEGYVEVNLSKEGGGELIKITTVNSSYNYDAWLIKINSTGHMEWNRTFGGNKSDYGNWLEVTSDGGYIITGSTESYGASGYNAWLIKIDSNGTEDWNRTFGGDLQDYGYSVTQTSDFGFVITGINENKLKSDFDIFLIKTSSNGSKEWGKCFGGDDFDWGNSVKQTSDDNLVICGTTGSYAEGLNDIIFILYDPRPPSNDPPVCEITNPRQGGIVTSKVLISGTAFDLDNDPIYIEIKIDNGSWSKCNGDFKWFYYWWSDDVDDGEHTIYVRAFDGEDYSNISVLNVIVDNKNPLDIDDSVESNEEDLGTWDRNMILALIIITIIFLLTVIMILRLLSEKQKPKKKAKS